MRGRRKSGPGFATIDERSTQKIPALQNGWPRRNRRRPFRPAGHSPSVPGEARGGPAKMPRGVAQEKAGQKWDPHLREVVRERLPRCFALLPPRLPIGLKAAGLLRKMPFHRRSGARSLKFAQKSECSAALPIVELPG